MEKRASKRFWRPDIVLLLTILAACESTPAIPPEGGAQLLPAAERALLTIAGRVDAVEKVDVHGYAARLQVESILARAAGGALLQPLETGDTVRIAWEELARARPPRLRAGDRVVVALDPLPSGSLWRQRFPKPMSGKEVVLAIAANGEALQRHPDPDSLTSLRRYLSLESRTRSSQEGVQALIQLMNGGGELCLAALAGLQGIESVDGKLSDQDRQAYLAISADRSRPGSCRVGALNAIADLRLVSMDAPLRPLAQPEFDLEPAVWDVRARLVGGLPKTEVESLLARDQPELRAVGARWARQNDLRDRLLTFMRSDPSPVVRSAAIESVVAISGAAIADQILGALTDPDPKVRLIAARTLGGLGEAAVPILRKRVESGDEEQARSAVLALDQAGPTGKEALAEIGEHHPNENVRNLALLALGKLEGHQH